jgi:hypothetical protein
MLGSVLALWLRTSLPLTIYVWAFLPALGATLLVSPGRHLIRDGYELGGTSLMWAGVVLTSVMLALIAWRVRRN